MRLPCWLGGHVWQTEVARIQLHIGMPNERECDIVFCTRCHKAKLSYGDYPPRRMPSAPPGMVPKPAEWPASTSEVQPINRKDFTMETIQLGQKGRDRVTGFEGIVTGVCNYLSGCNQALLVPRVGADGAYRAGEWFDVQRVEITEASMLTLDNSRTPGPDREAPKR